MLKISKIILLIFFITSGLKAQDQSHIDSLLQILKYSPQDTSRVNLLNEIANDIVYINSDKIYEYANEALQLGEKYNYSNGIAESYNNLGIYYRIKGIYDLSIDYFFNSLKIMEELNNRAGIARCYNLIGIIYYNLKNYDLSLKYYNKALDINIEQSDKKWIAGNYNNIGMIYRTKGNTDKALDYFFKSLEISIEINNKNWIANNYGNIGILYQQEGNPKSLDYYFKRLKIKEEQNDIGGIVSANNLIGKYYNSMSNYDIAITYLEKSYTLSRSIGNLPEINNSAEYLSEAFFGLKNFKEAYKYLKIFKNTNDSLNFTDNIQKITRLEMQYQNRKDTDLENLEYQKTELIYIVIFGILFLLILITILLFGRQRVKAKQQDLVQKNLRIETKLLKDELDFKKAELNDNIRYLVDKNELITTVSEKLIENKSSFKKENQEIINQVILELQSSIDSDIWQEFELRFNQVHNDFYENLNIKFPDLSANDKKLCAFLRLKMTSREISSLTQQSINSIEAARTRLRKKLNLKDHKTNLADFLAQF